MAFVDVKFIAFYPISEQNNGTADPCKEFSKEVLPACSLEHSLQPSASSTRKKPIEGAI